MQPKRLRVAIKHLGDALRETEVALDEMQADSDPLAVHIFVARRQCRNMPDTKSGKRSEIAARLSWQTACELGYRGSLEEWERLMGAKGKLLSPNESHGVDFRGSSHRSDVGEH